MKKHDQPYLHAGGGVRHGEIDGAGLLPGAKGARLCRAAVYKRYTPYLPANCYNMQNGRVGYPWAIHRKEARDI